MVQGEEESDDESCATRDDATIGESEHTDADTKSISGLSDGSLRATPEPDTILEPPPPIVEEPEPEPEPPSPAPEELWEYLKEVVTHDAVVSIDDLVEKLVTSVAAIPEPYLKSVVKESIKKQKSIEEEESHPADGAPVENAEGAPPAEGDATAAPPTGETPAEGAPTDAPPAEGTPTDAPPAEGAPAEPAPPAEGAPDAPAEPSPETAHEPAPAEPAPAVEAQPAMVEAAA